MTELEQQTREIHQAVFGVPHSEEKGLCGDISEIKELLKTQNGQVQTNRNSISKIKGIMIGLGLLGSGGVGMSIAQFIT